MADPDEALIEAIADELERAEEVIGAMTKALFGPGGRFAKESQP